MPARRTAMRKAMRDAAAFSPICSMVDAAIAKALSYTSVFRMLCNAMNAFRRASAHPLVHRPAYWLR